MKQLYRFKNTETGEVFVKQLDNKQMKEYLVKNTHIVLYRTS
jgi:hypothetical protein